MRILGIDLGSTSIKAVEIDSAFRRYEIHDYHEQPVAPGTPPEQAIRALMSSLPRLPDKVVVALKSGQTTFRTLQLPTKEKKAIQAGVGFELEDELPFPIENCVYDYTIIEQTKQGTTLHVAASLKRSIASSLETWKNGSVDPDWLTTESWAYRTLFNRVLGPQHQGRPVLLLQIGHERSTLYGHWKGAPVMAREIPWGGRDLTLALCQKFQIPLDQAEKMKLDHGALQPGQPGQGSAPGATAERLEISNALAEALQPILGDLRQAELTCKNVTDENLSAIYLAGGTSLLPGLGAFVEEQLSIPVIPAKGLSSVANSGVTYSEHSDATFLLASALALCLVSPDRTGVNFRKLEFAKKASGRGLDLEAFRRPLLGAGIVAASLFVSLIVQSFVYSSRLTETNALLKKSVRGFFGQLSESATRTYLSNTHTLKASIDRELAKQKNIAKVLGPNPNSPIDYLKDLSASIPRDVVVDMTYFQVGAAPNTSYLGPSESTPSSVSLAFVVPSRETADKLTQALSGKISGIQKGKVEPVQGATQQWKVTFSGRPVENAYGK